MNNPQQYFYHGLFRKYMILFGSLFNNIQIQRVDPNHNAHTKTIKVPLSYGPKQWYLERQNENPNIAKQISITLPRMAFQILSIRYAPERKLNSTNVTKSGNSYAGTLTRINEPVPYDIFIRLSIMTKNADDGMQVVEQILPRFVPEVTYTVKLVDDPEITKDIPIILGNVDLDDRFEGSMKDEDRTVVWNLDFVIKAYFYGPSERSGIIKFTNLSLYSDFSANNFLERYETQPGLTANGEPTTILADSIPVSEIQANTDWGFVKQFFETPFST